MAQSSVARSVTANSALSGTIATEPRSAQGSARTTSRRVARPAEVGYVSCTPPAESRSGAHYGQFHEARTLGSRRRHSEASVYTPALDLIAWPSPAAMPPFAASKPTVPGCPIYLLAAATHRPPRNMLKSRVFGIDFGSEGVFTSCEDANEQSGQPVATLFQSATSFKSSSPHPPGRFCTGRRRRG